MAHQHLGPGRDPAGGRCRRSVRHAAGVRELSGRPRRACGGGTGTAGNGLKLGQVEGRDATHYPLALIVQPGETLQLRLDYRPDLFERATWRPSAASHPAAGGRGCGRRTAAGPACRSWRAAERDTILRGWNDTRSRFRPLTLPALFAAQAARTPDAVAVVFEDRTLTYAALDAHANRLAHHLQSLGVGPETLVGLCVERSLEMVIGLARHPQGRRRLPAARSGLSARAADLHAVGRRLRGAADAGRGGRRAAAAGRRDPHPARARCRLRRRSRSCVSDRAAARRSASPVIWPT